MATYTVKRGDSLSKIASKYGISWRDLYNQNKSVIGSNPNLIYAGQKYTIPGTTAPEPVTAAPTVSAGTEMGQSAAPEMTPFSDVLSFGSYFDPNLARSSSEQIAAAYYVPQAQQGRQTLEGDFAGRGLTRSGQRGTSIGDLYGQLGQQQQASAETDISTMRSDAKGEYARMQELYEQSEGENAPTETTFGGYGYTPPTTSAGRYGTSYLNWLNNILRQ